MPPIHPKQNVLNKNSHARNQTSNLVKKNVHGLTTSFGQDGYGHILLDSDV